MVVSDCATVDQFLNSQPGPPASTTTRSVSFSLAYAPYGETYASTSGTDPAFTSQRQDTVSGIYDFPDREYAIYGRWISPDPLGISSFHLTDPQSLNRYAYARNNPMSIIDPTGLADCDTDSKSPDDYQRLYLGFSFGEEPPTTSATCGGSVSVGGGGGSASPPGSGPNPSNGVDPGQNPGTSNGPSSGDPINSGQGCSANDPACGSSGNQGCNIDKNFCGTFNCNLSDANCSVDSGSLCIDGQGNQTKCDQQNSYDQNGSCTSTSGVGDYPCGPGEAVVVKPSTDGPSNNNSNSQSPGLTEDLTTLFEAQDKLDLGVTNRILIPALMIGGGLTISAASAYATVQACVTVVGCTAVIGTGPTFVGGLWLASKGVSYAIHGKYPSSKP